MGIHSIKIQNFKSIRETDEILIKPLNVLIGANGAGKSNFISFFKFLNKLYDQELQLYVNQNGRAESFLYFGRKVSGFLGGKIVFDDENSGEYEFKLVPDQTGSLIFSSEKVNFIPEETRVEEELINSGGNFESKIKENTDHGTKHIKSQLASLKLFHFHDTSINAKVKQYCNTHDNAYLHEDAGNLAAFLFKLQESFPHHFKLITRVIQSIAPFIQEFFLMPDEINPRQILFRWKEKGSDNLFNAHSLSDGTVRMICLATLLLQPNPPSTIIIDEPELGLHPYAIQKLAAMIKSASIKSQLVVSTQSIHLVDHFSADDIIVVERDETQSVFTRQSEEALTTWREDYSLGELWVKNVIGGTP